MVPRRGDLNSQTALRVLALVLLCGHCKGGDPRCPCSPGRSLRCGPTWSWGWLAGWPAAGPSSTRRFPPPRPRSSWLLATSRLPTQTSRGFGAGPSAQNRHRSQVSTGELPTHRVARLCAGRRLCRGEMPFFQTKRAMAMMGKTNACKKPKLEPDEPPPQSMKRCRFIDCGEAGKVVQVWFALVGRLLAAACIVKV